MAKLPIAGRVKTRLASDIGSAAATSFYRHTCIAVLSRLSATSYWTTVVNIAPDTGLRSRFWPKHLVKTKQGDGDLGDRMRRAMTSAFDGPVILVGTDIPEIKRQHIHEAFAALRNNDVVFGPTPDGGFWLVGIAHLSHLRNAFANVRWSTEFALEDSIRSFKSRQPDVKVGLVSELNDIDHGSDFAAVRSLIGRRILSS